MEDAGTMTTELAVSRTTRKRKEELHHLNRRSKAITTERRERNQKDHQAHFDIHHHQAKEQQRYAKITYMGSAMKQTVRMDIHQFVESNKLKQENVREDPIVNFYIQENHIGDTVYRRKPWRKANQHRKQKQRHTEL